MRTAGTDHGLDQFHRGLHGVAFFKAAGSDPGQTSQINRSHPFVQFVGKRCDLIGRAATAHRFGPEGFGYVPVLQ